MHIKRIEMALFIGLCIAFMVGFTCVKEQKELSSKMIRLHVIANSDSEKDQDLKLKVRDDVTQYINSILTEEKDVQAAAVRILEALPLIEQIAQQVLTDNGCYDQVDARIGYEAYSTRIYDDFTLPAGQYNSLRIQIGNAVGKNWWCVVFPPLCFTAAGDFEETAVAAGITDEELELITDSDGKYVYKFKILEIVKKILDYLKEIG